jgi:hypothetical protein
MQVGIDSFAAPCSSQSALQAKVSNTFLADEFEDLTTARVIRDRKREGVESNACIRWPFDFY